MKRRNFLKKAGAGTAAAAAATAVSAPNVIAAKKTTIKWRLQTYAGPALAAHVIKSSIDAFNKVANGEGAGDDLPGNRALASEIHLREIARIRLFTEAPPQDESASTPRH